MHKNRNNFNEFFKKKVQSLLIPYFVFGIINYFFYLLIYRKWFDVGPLVHLVTDNTDGLMINGALWFLTALFWVDIIVFLLENYIKNVKIKILIVIFLSTFGIFETKILPFALPLSLGISFVGVGIYYIGYFIAKYSNLKKIKYILNLRKYQIIIFAVIITILIFLNGYINMRVRIYKNPLLFWTNLTASCIILINISKQLKKEKNSLIQKICHILEYIGKNSITYLVLNQFVILAFSNLLEGIAIKYIPSIINFILTLLILFILNKIITKTKLRIILGR